MTPPETRLPIDPVDWGFQQIHQDIQWLARSMAEVLEGLGEEPLARWIPWSSGGEAQETHEGPTPARLGLAMAMAFQLLNSVEERVSESLREVREEADSPETEKGLWFDQLSGLVKAGASADSIRDVFQSVEVEPVFTAHPTEAKRASVLERLYEHSQLSALSSQLFLG